MWPKGIIFQCNVLLYYATRAKNVNINEKIQIPNQDSAYNLNKVEYTCRVLKFSRPSQISIHLDKRSVRTNLPLYIILSRVAFPLSVQILSFSCSFQQKDLQNNRLVHPTRELAPPPAREIPDSLLMLFKFRRKELSD